MLIHDVIREVANLIQPKLYYAESDAIEAGTVLYHSKYPEYFIIHPDAMDEVRHICEDAGVKMVHLRDDDRNLPFPKEWDSK